MSVQTALNFIQCFRSGAGGGDPAIEGIRVNSMGDLIDLAKQLGFDISIRQLRQAHVIDWKMRCQYYRSKN